MYAKKNVRTGVIHFILLDKHFYYRLYKDTIEEDRFTAIDRILSICNRVMYNLILFTSLTLLGFLILEHIVLFPFF